MDEPVCAQIPASSRDLFQKVYDELRKLAGQQLSTERIDHTLNPTALVHEAYLRLVGKVQEDRPWTDAKQFFLLAAEAMRHILVDHARYHRRQKRGGKLHRQDLDENEVAAPQPMDVLAIHEALDLLAHERCEAADLVKLRYFAGLTLDEAAKILDLAPSTADRRWAFAKAWLLDRLGEPEKLAEKS